jgi:hypothetical protein
VLPEIAVLPDTLLAKEYKSAAMVDVEPSLSVYVVPELTPMIAGADVVKLNEFVPPVELPEKFTVNGIDDATVSISIVSQSGFAVTRIDQDGPASYPLRPKILVTKSWLDCWRYALAT